MWRRTVLVSLMVALAVGVGGVALASEVNFVKGGGSVLVPATGVFGSVGVNVRQSAGGVSGNVNLDLYDPTTGERRQHFKGAVTNVSFRAGGVAYLCGEVTLLQLGTQTNDGRYFELVIKDVGGPGSGDDRLGWYRRDHPTKCGDEDPPADQILTEGNLKVID